MKKYTCSECGRLLRSRCFIYNRVIKNRICRQCDKRIGTNIFYEPNIKGEKKKTKKYCRNKSRNFKNDEKEFLTKKNLKNGLTYEESKIKIKNFIEDLRRINRKEKKEDLNKKLIEGLKNA